MTDIRHLKVTSMGALPCSDNTTPSHPYASVLHCAPVMIEIYTVY